MKSYNEKSLFFWWALILLVCLSPIYGAVVFPKFFSSDYADQVARMQMVGTGEAARWVSRILKGLFILLPVIIIVLRRFHPCKFNRNALEFWFSAMVFALGPVLSSFLGAGSAFTYEVFVIPALLTAVFVLPPMPPDWFVRRMKALLLLVYVYGSIAAVLVSPGFALEMNYASGLLSSVRLHGLGTHANNLAPLLALYLLLECYWPGRGVVSRLHRSLALVLLIFTQSKTTFLAMLTIVAAQVLYRAWFQRPGAKGSVSIQRISLILCIGVIFLFLGMFSITLSGNVPASTIMSHFSTLIDRTLVWEYTLKLWKENMLFGYGPGLFGADISLKFSELHHWAPPHAHNQWFQTLGESGIVGEAGLVIYLWTLLRLGLRHINTTNGGSLALVLLLLVRGLTEVPFRTILVDGNFLIHFAVFGFLMLLSQSTGNVEFQTATTGFKPGGSC